MSDKGNENYRIVIGYYNFRAKKEKACIVDNGYMGMNPKDHQYISIPVDDLPEDDYFAEHNIPCASISKEGLRALRDFIDKELGEE